MDLNVIYVFKRSHLFMMSRVRWGNRTPLKRLFWNQSDNFFLLVKFQWRIWKAGISWAQKSIQKHYQDWEGGWKKKKSQHQWAVDTKDIEDNQCSARQKAWIKEALAKKQRCTLGAVLKLKAFFLFLHTLWTTSRTWSVMFCFKRLVNDQPHSSMQVKKQI